MNLLHPIETAVANGWNIVCAPYIYRMVRDKVRELEHKRNEQLSGPSMARPIDVEWHVKQRYPPLLVFDDWRAFRDYLDELNDE
jgi:hypothetical protein